MPAPLSYRFFGFVEDGFVNNGLQVSPAAFGYAPGQRITGSFTLTGEIAASWQSLPEDSRFLLAARDLAVNDVAFFFEQAATGNWTNADFVSSFDIGSTDDDRPLEFARATLFHASEPDGPTLRVDQLAYGGALLTNDDGLAAIVSGAWVPDGITPNLVYGTREADVLRANGELSLVWGGRGEDDIRVQSGEAFAWGGEGDDIIRGHAGSDFLWAGIGDDQVFGRGGNDQIRGEFGDDLLEGGDGDDRIEGGAGFDIIRGGGGNDILIGGGGPDGGFGTDIVLGGSGDDIIFSGQGHLDESGEIERSVSNGGSGNDTIDATFDAILTGGSGVDLFRLGDAFTGELAGLSVTDFVPGLDKLAVRAGTDFDTFEEIIAVARQQGDSVVFDFSPGSDSGPLPDLVLEEVRLRQLSSSDFLFGDI